MTKNVGDIIARLPADVKIIPGHGPLSTLDDLKAYHRMLIETAAIVLNGIGAGKTLAQLKAEGLPERWQSWGTGFIKTDAWIETIYRNFAPRTSKAKKARPRRQKSNWHPHGHEH